MGANLGQGRFGFGDRAAREHELFLVPACDHLHADRHTVDARSRPECSRPGMPEMLNGAVNGTEPIPPTLLAADLERRRALRP